MDIGGGSTEFILSEGKNIKGFCSTSLGVVRLTEKFITQHPVDEKEYHSLQNHLQCELQAVKNKLSAFLPETLIVTAGTVTTLAALKENIYPYDPKKFMVLHFLNQKQIQFSMTLKGNLSVNDC